MSRSPAARSVVAVAALLVCAVGATLALAHVKGFDSKVTIRAPEPGIYKGRVISERPRCEPGRTVKLVRPNGDVVATTTTDAEGRWQYGFIGERYYAKVTRRVDGTGAHRHVCRSDRSRTIDGY